MTGATKKLINRAFSYMLAKKSEMGIARELDVSDPASDVIKSISLPCADCEYIASARDKKTGITFFKF